MCVLFSPQILEKDEKGERRKKTIFPRDQLSFVWALFKKTSTTYCGKKVY